MSLMRALAVAALLSVYLTACSPDPDGPDAVEPTDEGQSSAEVTPEAQAVLEEMGEAYRTLKSAEFSGTQTLTTAEGQEQPLGEFTSTFQAPNRFRFETEGQFQTGSTGERGYLWFEEENRYIASEQTAVDQLIDPLPSLLQNQNLSLYLALADDPMEALQRVGERIERLPDAKRDGTTWIVLQVSQSARVGDDQIPMTTRLLVDPKTHLLRRVVRDVSSMPVPEGAEKAKEVTTDYTTVDVGVDFESDAFAWSPPPDAVDVSPPEVGRPAPEFTLTTLDGQTVSLGELKGNVVVLDFWATWCGPCRRTLPHFAELWQEMQDRDVRFYAVNLRESKPEAQAFVEEMGLKVPVLLDESGAAGSRYQVRGIPHTVVIGKDGRIAEIFSGLPPDEFGRLRTAVEQALRQ